MNLKQMLADSCPDFMVTGEAVDVASALQLIKQNPPDTIFMDINFKDGTGFDLLNKLDNPTFQVVFTATCGQFAMNAFQYNVVDYLLKPVDLHDLVRAVNKIRRSGRHTFLPGLFKKEVTPTYTDKIALSTSNGLAFVKLNQVIYLRSEGSYTTFYMRDGKNLTVCKGLKNFDGGGLPCNHFFRTHQSFMVNAEWVEEITSKDGHFALMYGGAEIPVSRRKKDSFVEFLHSRILG